MKLILFTLFTLFKLFKTSVKACDYYRFTGFGDFDAGSYIKVFDRDHVHLVSGDNTLKENPDCNWVLSSGLYKFPRYTSLKCVPAYQFGRLKWRMEDGNTSRAVNADITCDTFGTASFFLKVLLVFIIVVGGAAWFHIIYTMNRRLVPEI